VAQDRYALQETFLHRLDRALRSVNCRFLSQRFTQPSQFPAAKYAAPCGVELQVLLLVILSLPTARVQPRWRLLPQKPLQEPAVLPKGEVQTSPIRKAGNRFRVR
jgi:hypothetical protein